MGTDRKAEHCDTPWLAARREHRSGVGPRPSHAAPFPLPDWVANLRSAPDPALASRRYANLASGYDATCRRIAALRAVAIERLAIRPGETVIDVACGTGATTEALARAIGPTGCVVGIELSPQMAQRARDRLAAAGLTQARIEVASVQDAAVGERADAFLLSYTHDVLQQPSAVAALVRMARPGARVAVLGMRTLPWIWGWPINLFVTWRSRRYLTTWHGLAAPWALLADHVHDLRVVGTWHAGTSYLALGTFDAKGDVD
jgi:demethylmenaquinone methyltransferase/2-methoxy-6-polyprenyl-1,4-benzoquinol methylase